MRSLSPSLLITRQIIQPPGSLLPYDCFQPKVKVWFPKDQCIQLLYFKLFNTCSSTGLKPGTHVTFFSFNLASWTEKKNWQIAVLTHAMLVWWSSSLCFYVLTGGLPPHTEPEHTDLTTLYASTDWMLFSQHAPLSKADFCQKDNSTHFFFFLQNSPQTQLGTKWKKHQAGTWDVKLLMKMSFHHQDLQCYHQWKLLHFAPTMVPNLLIYFFL